MTKLQNALIVVLSIILVAVCVAGGIKYYNKHHATDTDEVAKTTEAGNATSDELATEVAEAGNDETEVETGGDAMVIVPEAIANGEVVSEIDDAVITKTVAGKGSGNSEVEEAYIEDVTPEDVEAFNNAFPVLTTGTANKIIADYNSQFNYEQWPDKSYKIPFSWHSMTENDFNRQKSAVWDGLSKKEINDALDYIFDRLTEEDIQKLLKLTFGSTVDLSNQEQVKLELFQTWLENPVAFEAWLNFMQDLKVGESGTLAENCPGLRTYLSENRAARTGNGAGIMIRLRDEEGNTGMAIKDVDHLYVNQSHIMAVCQLISFMEPLELGAGRYHVSRRYHLVGFDYNHLRVATETKEDEPDLDYWLTFSYYLKGGKRAFFIGANLADRSPGEIQNTSTVKKSSVKKTSVTNKTTKVTQRVTKVTTGPTPGGGGGPTPNPTPPDPKPTPPDKKKETKNPSEDPAERGNAPIGGGKNDDSGPGEQKPDLGNSPSPNVPDSQYQPGNSENPGTGESYDPGPPADNTDGGTPPETKPIEEHPSNNDGDTGSHNGEMGGAPPVDD